MYTWYKSCGADRSNQGKEASRKNVYIARDPALMRLMAGRTYFFSRRINCDNQTHQANGHSCDHPAF
jgi:hypothetical protein